MCYGNFLVKNSSAKYLDQLRVKLRSGAAAKLFYCFNLGEVAAVIAPGGHGIVTVCNGDNAGKRSYLITTYSIGVAVPINSFMVVENNIPLAAGE